MDIEELIKQFETDHNVTLNPKQREAAEGMGKLLQILWEGKEKNGSSN